jgi:hypothetical protein
MAIESFCCPHPAAPCEPDSWSANYTHLVILPQAIAGLVLPFRYLPGRNGTLPAGITTASTECRTTLAFDMHQFEYIKNTI